MIKNLLIMLVLFTTGYIFGLNTEKIEVQIKNPETPITIVYQDDCYMDKDFKHEILGAKETQELLKGIR